MPTTYVAFDVPLNRVPASRCRHQRGEIKGDAAHCQRRSGEDHRQG